MNFLSIFFPSKRNDTHFLGLSLRSKLEAFWSISLSAQLWAGIFGEIIVMSSANPLTVCGADGQVLIDFASSRIFFGGNLGGLVEKGRNVLWPFLVCS